MIVDLNLTIALRIIGHGELVGNLILNAEAGHFLTDKVCSVVRENDVRESEAIHDVLPNKFDNLLSNNFGEWHCLNLFGELVGGYQLEPQLRLCLGEWTNYVQPPLHEGLRTPQSMEVSTRPIRSGANL